MSNQKKKRTEALNWTIPEIPDKVYFTIGEVGKICNLKPHVLRFWEQEFPLLSPVKRRGNRRYYQHKDLELILQIKDLLYRQGYTIEGARQCLHARKTKSQATSIKTAVANLESILDQL